MQLQEDKIINRLSELQSLGTKSAEKSQGSDKGLDNVGHFESVCDVLKFEPEEDKEVSEQELRDKDFIEEMKRKYLDNKNEFVRESPLIKED